ncbi:MAG TPA: GNAT family N-acetyltransferase [Solirubrobacteraceae bacterium]|nr:GNAT family N-acetyltransferase [Solirubrobacteraceae bacterium]
MGDRAKALRDGRLVAVSAAAAGDGAEIPRLLAAVDDPRSDAFAHAHEPGAAAATLVARALEGGALLGYAALVAAAGGEAHGDFFCAVDPAATGLGLGTLLLRTAASAADERGLRTLRVALHPQARALAAMLRDCGLRSHWDLEHPVAHVELLLGQRRPGWATP